MGPFFGTLYDLIETLEPGSFLSTSPLDAGPEPGCGPDRGDGGEGGNERHDMRKERTMRSLLSMICVAGILALAGCGGQSSSEDASPAANDQVAAPGPDVLAALALADMADGTEDKTVSQCYGCALHMAGNAEHAVQVGDYQVHLCSAECKESFAADPSKMILAVAIPEDHSGHDH